MSDIFGAWFPLGSAVNLVAAEAWVNPARR